MSLIPALSAYLSQSPTPFHAVRTGAELLLAAGFEQLDESTPWRCQPKGRYFCIRSGALVAFTLGEQGVPTSFRLVGAHTDSPNLKLKPRPLRVTKGYLTLGVEVYGGTLLNPWFDRDLSLAGRVSYLDGQGKIARALIDLKRPVGCIPSLAIHLDRGANENRTVNAQTDMNVVLGPVQGAAPDFDHLLTRMVNDALAMDAGDLAAPREILSHELSLYDCQAPAIVGLNADLFASARLDNLLSCFVALQAMIDSTSDQPGIVVLNDHEEVGSGSDSGAMGPMLDNVLVRLIPDHEARQIALRRSLLLSVDNAHGIHPNYANRHDDLHGPLLNAGPVIKINANQSYATNAETEAVLRVLARATGQGQQIPLQSFVSRSDTRCGSTIGPITATNIGVPTIDIGVPTFAMHSIRELAGIRDVAYLHELIMRFFASDLSAL